jgi:hypothetical protein
MKNNKLKVLALVAGFILNIGSAHAVNMSYTLYADLTVNLPTAISPSNQTGRVWIGNFGSEANGTLLSQADVQAGGSSLLSSFRPLASFGISNGSLVGDTGNGLRGSNINVGNGITGAYNVAAGQFAGQDAYILALAEVSTVWTDALASWAASGTNSAIVIRSAMNFTANTGDPVVDFALDADNGSLIFGTQTASSITSAAIPEPSVTTLLVLGALGLGALRLRRQTV